MPASELFAVLELETESNLQQARNHKSETSISGDNMSLDSKSCEGALLKSKVINSGGTVIVLTESDQQPRPVIGHSISNIAQGELHSRSYLNEVSYGMENARSPTHDSMNESHDFNIEKGCEEDTSLDSDGRLVEPPNYQVRSTDTSDVSSADPGTDFVTINSHLPNSHHSVYKMARSPVQNFVPKDQGPRGKLPPPSTEKNNNSLGKRALINNTSEEDGEQLDTVVVDASNNISSRYENVLFQKNQDYGRLNQDFGRLSNDEEYIMHNRAKGKVH